MIKKIKVALLILPLLVMLFACKASVYNPVGPDDPTEGTIIADYYRVVSWTGGDSVQIVLSWENWRPKDMEKKEEDHFQLNLERVPDNKKYRGNYDGAHKISLLDHRIRDFVAEKLYLNGTLITRVAYDESGNPILYFWYNAKTNEVLQQQGKDFTRRLIQVALFFYLLIIYFKV